jgi:hypothetical protein
MFSPSTPTPPSSPLAHRRTLVNPNVHYPLSPPSSASTSPCTSHRMFLPKGATFHVSSSPPTEDAPLLSIPHLARRSPTCSQSSLVSLLFDKEDLAVRSIENFERTFSGARGNSRRHRQRAADRLTDTRSDQGLGLSVGTPTDKDLTRVFDRALDLDSGLGSSIQSDRAKATRPLVRLDAVGDDGLAAADLIQGWLKRCELMGLDFVDTQTAGAVNLSSETRQHGSYQSPPLPSFDRSLLWSQTCCEDHVWARSSPTISWDPFFKRIASSSCIHSSLPST